LRVVPDTGEQLAVWDIIVAAEQLSFTGCAAGIQEIASRVNKRARNFSFIFCGEGSPFSQ
jgi:hypothetical protein